MPRCPAHRLSAASLGGGLRFAGGVGLCAVLLCVAFIWPIAVATRPRATERRHDADQALANILEQAGGPGHALPQPAEAMAAAREHLDKQEAALRDFAARFPADGRRYSAQIRLSGVLRGKVKILAKPRAAGRSQKTPRPIWRTIRPPRHPSKRTSRFAQISQNDGGHGRARGPRRAREPDADSIRRFDNRFPRRPPHRRPVGGSGHALRRRTRPRNGGCWTRRAPVTTDEALRLRIADDLKRLDLLGKPLGPASAAVAGRRRQIDLASHHGRVVVLVFWASWSGPALRELAALLQTAHRFAGKPVDFLTVSLDEDRAALAATIKAADLRWPVHCDGRGWKGRTGAIPGDQRAANGLCAGPARKPGRAQRARRRGRRDRAGAAGAVRFLASSSENDTSYRLCMLLRPYGYQVVPIFPPQRYLEL